MAKKDVDISTRVFELKIHVNTKTISTQVAVFIGLGLLWYFSGSSAVRVLCTIFLVIDLLIVFILLFDKKESSGEKKDTNTVSHDKPADVTDKKKTNSSPVKESKGTITNKVPIPNPTPVKVEEPKVEQTTPEVTVETQPEEVDWGELFDNM